MSSRKEPVPCWVEQANQDGSNRTWTSEPAAESKGCVRVSYGS